jgi:hypothetical protein
MADPKSAPPPPAPYANIMQVTHTQAEFFLVFGQALPQQQGSAHLISQIVTSPKHAKQILHALADNIRKYEEKFGEIPVDPTPPTREIQ